MVFYDRLGTHLVHFCVLRPGERDDARPRLAKHLGRHGRHLVLVRAAHRRQVGALLQPPELLLRVGPRAQAGLRVLVQAAGHRAIDGRVVVICEKKENIEKRVNEEGGAGAGQITNRNSTQNRWKCAEECLVRAHPHEVQRLAHSDRFPPRARSPHSVSGEQVRPVPFFATLPKG